MGSERGRGTTPGHLSRWRPSMLGTGDAPSTPSACSIPRITLGILYCTVLRVAWLCAAACTPSELR